MYQHQGIWLFAATCFIYLSVNFSTVSAKCRGKWSIHACLGGNGKRSGPPSSVSNGAGENNGYLLKQLLLQSEANSDRNSFTNDMDQYYPENMVQSQQEAVNIPVVLDEDRMSENDLDLESLADLVQELMYRKKLRKLSNEAAGLV